MSSEPRRSQTHHHTREDVAPYDSSKSQSPVGLRGRSSSKSTTKETTTTTTTTVTKKITYSGPLFSCYVPFGHPPAASSTNVAAAAFSAFTQIFKNQQSQIDESPFLRDFPLFNISQSLTYFGRKTADTRDAFGFVHGDRLVYQRGPRRYAVTTVVGARGGRLWVLDDDLDFPRALSETSYEAIQAVHDFAQHEPRRNLKPATIPQELTQEVLNFLRQAPDLYLKIGESTVFLCPTYILTGAGSVGWVGEDSIKVTGGGVQGIVTNATASVVVPAHITADSIRNPRLAPEDIPPPATAADTGDE